MVELISECGDAFPDATEWSLEFLRPLDGHGLYRLLEYGHARRHPNHMLQILDRIVDADILPPHQRHTLGEILDELRQADVDLAADARFRRLHGIATL